MLVLGRIHGCIQRQCSAGYGYVCWCGNGYTDVYRGIYNVPDCGSNHDYNSETRPGFEPAVRHVKMPANDCVSLTKPLALIPDN